MTRTRLFVFSLAMSAGVACALGACTLAPNPDLPYTDAGKGDGVTDNGDDGLDPGNDGDSAEGGGGSGGEGGQGGDGGTEDEN